MTAKAQIESINGFADWNYFLAFRQENERFAAALLAWMMRANAAYLIVTFYLMMGTTTCSFYQKDDVIVSVIVVEQATGRLLYEYRQRVC